MPRVLPDRESALSRARAWLLLTSALCAAGGALWWALDLGGAVPAADRPAAIERSVESPGTAGPVDVGPVQASGRRDAIGSKLVLVGVEVAPSGAIAAVLSVNDGAPRRHVLGDSLGPGLRLARIGLNGVTIERGGALELLLLPKGMEAARKDRLAAAPVPRLSETLPNPPTPEVAQVLDAAPAPAIVTPSPDRPNPARSGVDRMVAAEALRLSTR